jgi:hypothetical protein
MTAPREPRDAAFDAAWREHSTETPPAHVDDAILAAAHRAVGSAPRAADAPSASRPWKWWMPLSAAAAIGAIAFGALDMMPREVDETSRIASDAPTAPTRPAADSAQRAPAASATANTIPSAAPAPAATSTQADNTTKPSSTDRSAAESAPSTATRTTTAPPSRAATSSLQSSLERAPSSNAGRDAVTTPRKENADPFPALAKQRANELSSERKTAPSSQRFEENRDQREQHAAIQPAPPRPEAIGRVAEAAVNRVAPSGPPAPPAPPSSPPASPAGAAAPSSSAASSIAAAPSPAPASPVMTPAPAPQAAAPRDALSEDKLQDRTGTAMRAPSGERQASEPLPAPPPPRIAQAPRGDTEQAARNRADLASAPREAAANAPVPTPQPFPGSRDESLSANANSAFARKDAATGSRLAAKRSGEMTAAAPATVPSQTGRPTEKLETDDASPSARAKVTRRSVADYLARIRALRGQGNEREAVEELRAFRAAYQDADARLPADLRTWAVAVPR